MEQPSHSQKYHLAVHWLRETCVEAWGVRAKKPSLEVACGFALPVGGGADDRRVWESKTTRVRANVTCEECQRAMGRTPEAE